MTSEHEQRILEAARRYYRSEAGTVEHGEAHQALIAATEDAEAQAPAHTFEPGDWVEWAHRGYQVADVHGTSVGLDGVAIWIAASDCLPIPPRPEPRDGWEPDGVIVDEGTDWRVVAWFGHCNQSVGMSANGPLYHDKFGPRRWRAVRAKVEAVPDSRPPRMPYYQPLFDHMMITYKLALYDVQMDEIVRVVESLKAAPVPEAPTPAADETREALRELVAAVKTVGDPSLREMVLRRAVKRAEEVL